MAHFRRKALFLLSLPATIYFNFKHFPFKQAIKLPVLLWLPRLSGKGKYKIEGPVRPGMIRLGSPIISLFRDQGINLENRGNIIFKGSATIGGGSGISVGEKGTLIFGNKFSNLMGAKIICYHSVVFDNTVRLGWRTMVMDTDFHRMKSIETGEYTKGYGPIHIGEEVWVGTDCKILKNSNIPSRCTVATGSIVNKKIECPSYSLIYSGGGLKIKHTGFYRDVLDDTISY